MPSWTPDGPLGFMPAFSRGGIVGGSMLGLGRALGETIAVSLLKDWRNAEPAAYDGGPFGTFGTWAALVLFVVICAPLLIRGLVRRFRR